MNYPKISIIIPTFNSENTIGKTLQSIKQQTYPKKYIQTLILDGGSTDQTRAIAKKYDCTIIPNPKTELIYGKHIGYLSAQGKYAMFLDSDEVLENIESLKIKYLAFTKDKRIKGVMPSGYKTPKNFSLINNYINEIGDPFSFFNYRLSQDARFYRKLLSKRARVVCDDENCTVFDFSNTKNLPIIELMAGGGIIDLAYMKAYFPEIKNNPSLIAFFFYLMLQKNAFLAVTKNDRVIHYSSANLQKYLKKISSRVKNNTFQTTMGKGGFSGRELYQSKISRLKKYLFIPYSLTILFPTLDALYFVMTRKKIIYFIHIPLCIYISLIIIYYQFRKYLKIVPVMKTYGQ